MQRPHRCPSCTCVPRTRHRIKYQDPRADVVTERSDDGGDNWEVDQVYTSEEWAEYVKLLWPEEAADE